MKATVETQLGLYQWGKILGINPWELSQFGRGFPEENYQQCPHVWFQFPWQEDALTRDEVAEAISNAEALLARELHYWPAPKYVEETIANPKFRYGWKGGMIRTTWSKVIGGGVMTRSLIDDTVVPVFSDFDGDSLDERVTLTVPTTVTDPDEIAVYYPEIERDTPLDETWRIKPLRVTIAGGVATIVGHATQFARPTLYTVYDPQSLDVTDPTNYVTSVEVYRVYRDVQYDAENLSQGWALWDEPAGPCTEVPCTQTSSPICLGEYDAELGYSLYTYTDDTCLTWRAPDRLRLRYLAGVPQVNGGMDPEYAKIVTYLSVAMLPTEACGCERSNRIIHYWRSLPIEGEEYARFRPIMFSEILSATGEKRGGIYAWKKLMQLRQYGGASI